MFHSSACPVFTALSAYTATLTRVAWIDDHLQRGTRHFRQASDGRLLHTLDEVCRALGENDLICGRVEELRTVEKQRASEGI